nr:OmpA family protein [Geoalkalibacter sp.]
MEIHSDHPAILDLVRSTYLNYRIDNSSLIVRPLIDSLYGVADWRIQVSAGGTTLAEVAGEGAPNDHYLLPLKLDRPQDVGAAGSIAVSLEARDRRDQQLSVAAEPVKVQFLQTSRRLAQQLDYRVQEKYALILFDFDRDTIDARNQGIVEQIAARIRALPQAAVEIVGHTDNIGSDAYNQKLSERRAKAVYDLLLAAAGGDPDKRIQYRGAGAQDPPYDNLSSESRAFNRTVAITLEYLARD